MAEYEDGEAGQVMHESYCLKKSVEAKNVDQMSEAMGYHNMADQANSKIFPVQMEGAKRNEQKGPMAGKGNYNYDKDRS